MPCNCGTKMVSSALRCLNQKMKVLNEIGNVNLEKYLKVLKVRYIWNKMEEIVKWEWFKHTMYSKPEKCTTYGKKIQSDGPIPHIISGQEQIQPLI